MAGPPRARASRSRPCIAAARHGRRRRRPPDARTAASRAVLVGSPATSSSASRCSSSAAGAAGPVRWSAPSSPSLSPARERRRPGHRLRRRPVRAAAGRCGSAPRSSAPRRRPAVDAGPADECDRRRRPASPLVVVLPGAVGAWARTRADLVAALTRAGRAGRGRAGAAGPRRRRSPSGPASPARCTTPSATG